MSTSQEALRRLRPDIAWQRYFPNAANPWNVARAAHLLRRVGFAPSWGQVMEAARSGPDAALAKATTPDESQEREFEADVARVQDGVLGSSDPRQLKGLWLYRMVHSPFPLRERLTLFWHDHFATSNAKVNNVRLMDRQVATFRRHALGRFGDLLSEITFDPAMLIWLDSNTNRKGQPNENYAREVFELFSLGPGNYTEKDIQEAARALTGWSVLDGKAVFTPADFDAGEKTILGQTGPWGAGDVVRIALAQKACGRFLVRKLFAEFVSESVELSDAYLDPLAEEFRVRNYDVSWLMTKMLGSWLFFSHAAMSQRVKGPVEFLVGTVRALEGTSGPLPLADLCDQLGQSPYYPPSVKGWDGGSNWLNSTTLLFRQNFAFDITRGEGFGSRADPARLVAKYHLAGDEAIAGFFLNLFHQNPQHESLPSIVEHLRAERERLAAEGYTSAAVDKLLARGAAHLAMTLPEYQLC